MSTPHRARKDETVLWVNAATGETIAESATNPSTAVGSLINPRYGGRFYTMGNYGSLFIYQVQSCEDATIMSARHGLTRRGRALKAKPQAVSRKEERCGGRSE